MRTFRIAFLAWFILCVSGVQAQIVGDIRCVKVNSDNEAIRYITKIVETSASVLWVHRQSVKSFPPCANQGVKSTPTDYPYWVVSAADPQRQFYVYQPMVRGTVLPRSTHRAGFVTLHDLIDATDDTLRSRMDEGEPAHFAANVIASERYAFPVLLLSSFIGACLLILAIWNRTSHKSLFFVRVLAGFPLALYVFGAPSVGYVLFGLTFICCVFLRVSVTLQLTAVIVLLDQLTLNMGDYSPLQGFFYSGFRFYGVGNELLGVFIGTLALCIPKNYRVLVAMAGCIFFGTGFLGADFGAVVVFGSLVTWDALRKWRTTAVPSLIFLAAISVLLGVGLSVVAAWLDAQWAHNPSHAGQALQTIGSTGANRLFDIVAGKIGMHVGLLLRFETLVACGVVAAFTWFLRFDICRRAQWQSSPRYLAAAVLLGLVFNDSGVVTAMLALVTAFVMIPEVLHEK